MTTSTRKGSVTAPQTAQLPLCVDLDGTLVNTDLLVEGFLLACRSWRRLRDLPALMFAGKAGLKRGLAQLSPVDCTLLAYNRPLIDFLREQKSLGRRLVLVTAADRQIASKVDEHLEHLFDEVIASDGERNLRGSEKARVLVERFGERGFVYAGNDRTDLEVWSNAGGVVLVNAPSGVARRAGDLGRIERAFPRERSILAAATREIRPYQWAKNLLVFVPIVTAGAFGNFEAWVGALIAFAAFSATASAVYVMNDLFDLEADRKHLHKRWRPLASGALPLAAGIVLVPALLVVGLALAALAGILPYIAGYAALSLAYSVKLKEKPLVDIFLLAMLYLARLFAGGVATGYEVSLWLLAFAGFLFFALAAMKRVAELRALEKEAGGTRIARRGYMITDLPTLMSFGTSSSFVSAMVLALFVRSDKAAIAIGNPEVLWCVVPLMLFWQCRMWLSTSRGYMTDDPIVFAAKDWVSALIGLGLISVIAIARALP